MQHPRHPRQNTWQPQGLEGLKGLEEHPPLKLNLGCGYNKLEGYLNVDSSPACEPDVRCNLDDAPWPWASDSVQEVIFFHALEHMGASTAAFLALMQELYRVCRDGALIKITVPHPRHDNFIGDPTHVRIITPMVLSLFCKANCAQWRAQGASNTALADYLQVDFQTLHAEARLEPRYLEALRAGQLSESDLQHLLRERNNVANEFYIELRVNKGQR